MSKFSDLKNKYAHLFSNRFWGFECGEGWYPLLEDMLSKMDKLEDKPNIVQIKEKFGGLRVYYDCDGECSPIEQLVNEAEKIADNTCESCGASPAKNRPSKTGWLRTICEPCNTK